jgi:small subunit ribosomal protein S17
MTKDQPNNKISRRFNGVVVSDGMENTLSVKVDNVKIHPTYKKRYTTSKNYLCDYRKDDIKVGDKVIFEETRPISKKKRWRIIKKV